jgi:hypothetical protein
VKPGRFRVAFCTPSTCGQNGWQCGTGDDGCGGQLQCGDCNGGACDQNSHSCSCVPAKTCTSLRYACGSFNDSCGAIEVCGPQPSPDPNSDLLCTDPARPHLYRCACFGIHGPNNLDASAISDDASFACLGGPPNPEPSWDCVPFGSGNPAIAWCCAQ